jgi:hypothetical protein
VPSIVAPEARKTPLQGQPARSDAPEVPVYEPVPGEGGIHQTGLDLLID